MQTLSSMEAKTPSARYRRTIHIEGEPRVPPVPSLKGNISVADIPIEYGYAVTSDDVPVLPTPPTSASVYSDGFNTARSSAVTAVDPAFNSAIALLTFREQQEAARATYELSTTSKSRGYHLPLHQPPLRKSSLKYINSDENAEPSRQPIQGQARIPSLRLSSSFNKQNIPKSSLKEDVTTSRSPLRKLTLLGNRDGNRPLEDNVDSGASTSPLSINKRTKKDASGLRPLRLARSATAKARGLLRQKEVLPEVVVRPPSTNEDEIAIYSFQ